MARCPLPLSAIVAFIVDRREQYDQSSGIFAALEDLADAFRQGDAHEAYRTGELDDLLPRNARCDDVNAYAEHHEEYAETADWRSRALAAEAALVGLLEAMELQEDREGGLAHVTAPTMLALWNKAKERARRALEVSRG